MLHLRWLRRPEARRLAPQGLRHATQWPHLMQTASVVTIPESRIALWQREFERQQQEQLAKASAGGESIEITVQQSQQDGAAGGIGYQFQGMAGVTTAIDVIKQMNDQGLPKVQALAVQLNGAEVVDLKRPLDSSCALEFLEYVLNGLEHPLLVYGPF